MNAEKCTTSHTCNGYEHVPYSDQFSATTAIQHPIANTNSASRTTRIATTWRLYSTCYEQR